MLKAWLTRHGAASVALCYEMAKWAELLGTMQPDYAKTRALNHVSLIAVDKQPGVRPIGCDSSQSCPRSMQGKGA